MHLFFVLTQSLCALWSAETTTARSVFINNTSAPTMVSKIQKHTPCNFQPNNHSGHNVGNEGGSSSVVGI